MRLAAYVSSFALATGLLLTPPAAGGDTQAPAAAVQDTDRQIPTQLPRSIEPLHYSISAAPNPEAMTFDGKVDIAISIIEPVRTITLNAVDLEFRSVNLAGPGGQTLQPTETALDPAAQTATFRFAETLMPGRYRLSIDYSGRINTQSTGLFALDYPSAEGMKRSLFTQFEAPDARRFFPSWDEPRFRTPYDLSVIVPAGQMAVSNMPVARSETRPDGSSLVTFGTTPAMSSYLLFLAMGDFERISATAAGVDLGIVTRRGAGEQGRFALEGVADILPWYNDYFGTPYPLPKLDNVAGPGSSQFFLAMENWGAIFSFEGTLLVDPALTSEVQRQFLYEVLAHEVSHQWFGNLVTMAWWDDLWLNEGFASWMARKATAAIHPEWQPLLGRISGREEAMTLDSVASTHPIVQRIETVDQISQAFDDITYSKGEAVITMLEDYVGEDSWRNGVRDYMARHRLGNTVTDDLWRAIEGQSDTPVVAIAHDFLFQPGIPLIRIEEARCSNGSTEIRLRQDEFTIDRPDKTPLRWRVPVIAAAGGGDARFLVEGGAARASVPGCGPLIVNSGQAGYYRTLYSPALLERITENFPSLRPMDQIGLLADNWELGRAGYQPASRALAMIDATPLDANPRVWEQIAPILSGFQGAFEGDSRHQAMAKAYVTKRLKPVLDRIGWEARPGEHARESVLRALLIGTLGQIGNPEVVAEANRRFAANDPSVLTGPLRQSIIGIVARNADAATWEMFRERARTETSPLARIQLYQQLASVRDEDLARRALNLALTGEPGPTNSSLIIGAVGGTHPDMTYDFALAHHDAVMALIDASSRTRFLPRIAAGSADPGMIAKLRDYAERHMTPESRRPADEAIAAIEARLRSRDLWLPEATRWLEARAR